WNWRGDAPPPLGGRDRVKSALRTAYLRVMLGDRRRRPSIPADARAVVAATGSNLGGAIVALPLLHAIRARFPSAHLAVVSNSDAGLDVVRFAGIGDSHHRLVDGSLRDPAVRAKARRLITELRSLRADVLVSNWDNRLDN